MSPSDADPDLTISSEYWPTESSLVYYSVHPDGKTVETLCYPKRPDHVGPLNDLSRGVQLALVEAMGKTEESFMGKSKSKSKSSNSTSKSDRVMSNALRSIDQTLRDTAHKASISTIKGEPDVPDKFGTVKIPTKSFGSLIDLKYKMDTENVKGWIIVSSNYPTEFQDTIRAGQPMTTEGVLSPKLFDADERERERRGLSGFANHVESLLRDYDHDPSWTSFDTFSQLYHGGRYGHVVLTDEEKRYYQGITSWLSAPKERLSAVTSNERHHTDFHPDAGANSDFDAVFAGYGK
ncbi:hypothetical protein V865_006272 [Kwoniella europaea PYCC6329]|uniref:Uncharacterized protein n=1 Tax=Kwoniella europaea PYCC6329 TaxID=1423913 RepID=A0AAX4KNZ1_9TREE